MTRSIFILLILMFINLWSRADEHNDSTSTKSADYDIESSAGIPSDSISKMMKDSVVNRSQSSRPVREITPVDIDDKKPTVVMHYYDKHGNPLNEPVMFLATLDTVTKPKTKPLYPLYNGISAGINFGEAILMAAGQSYASFGVWADVSLHNWFFPVIEAGVGFADSHPKNSNFSYKTRPSFYAKAGINYNFLYKSNPDYQFYIGLRAGFSSFRYDVDNINISSDYWGETQEFNLKNIKAKAIYGEALAGLKVKIVKWFSIGWDIRYHFKFKVYSSSSSRPWFIPGYGANSPIGFSASLIFTLPGKKVIDESAEK